MSEYWKQVRGYNGKYQVSNKGRVKSLYGGNERILKQNPSGKAGYLAVNLCIDGQPENVGVHKLVAETFLSNINKKEGYHICHKNGIATDNRLINLRFDSPTENKIDEYRNGGSYYLNGLNRYEVYAIRELFKIGYDRKKLSRMFDCSYGNINRIINRKRFDFINDDGTIADSTTSFDIHDRKKQLNYSSGKVDSGKQQGNNKVLQRFNRVKVS